MIGSRRRRRKKEWERKRSRGRREKEGQKKKEKKKNRQKENKKKGRKGGDQETGRKRERMWNMHFLRLQKAVALPTWLILRAVYWKGRSYCNLWYGVKYVQKLYRRVLVTNTIKQDQIIGSNYHTKWVLQSMFMAFWNDVAAYRDLARTGLGVEWSWSVIVTWSTSQLIPNLILPFLSTVIHERPDSYSKK